MSPTLALVNISTYRNLAAESLRMAASVVSCAPEAAAAHVIDADMWNAAADRLAATLSA